MPTPAPAEKALRSDPGFVSATKKLDHARLQQLTVRLELGLAIGLNYHNRLEDASRAKVRAGKADRQAESQLAQMGKATVDACTDAENALGEFSVMLTETGLEEVMNQHVPTMFKNYDDNATIQARLARCRSLGARDKSLKCVRDELAKGDFDVLRLKGEDETVSGLIRAARTKEVQNLIEIIQTRGLPTIMGRGAGFAALAVFLLILGAILTIRDAIGAPHGG